VAITSPTDLRNTDPTLTALTVRQNPVGGATNCHAVQIKQGATSGAGAGLNVVSYNVDTAALRVQGSGPLVHLYNAANELKFAIDNDGQLQLLDALTVSAVASPPDTSSLPLGPTNAARNTGIQLVGSFAGGEDNSSGTDSTPRINIYSYQRAATNSFGEIQRMWLMREDSKAMLAWYGPQLTGTQTNGYDANRNALTTGVSWQPWAWIGAHYEANDHASIHGHISIEVPDSDGALQTRFEILFADRTTGALGLDKSFIITNDADFSMRQSSGEEFRIVAPAGTEKRITFSGDAFGTDSARRWKLRSTSTAEAGANAGSDFELVRYDDSGVAQSATFIIKRSNGYAGFGTALSNITAQITVRTDGIASGIFSSVSAEGTASTAVNRIETTTTTKRAFDYRLTGDGVSRLRLDATSGSGSGTITFGDGTTADTNIYRASANALATDDSWTVFGHALGIVQPSSHGLIAWNGDPAVATSSIAGTSGTAYLMAVYVPRSVTTSKVWFIVGATAAATVSSAQVGIYDSAGNLVASADASTAFNNASTAVSVNLAASLTAGRYWVGYVMAAQTMPTLCRPAAVTAAQLNLNLTASTARYAVNGTGLSALPSPITPSSNDTASARAFWVGLS
jgi:hypothetical protein